MSRRNFILIFTLLTTVVAIHYLFPQWEKMDFNLEPKLRYGLDLQGGTYLKIEVKTDQIPLIDGKPTVSTGEAVDRVLRVLRNRVDSLGLAEPLIQKEGKNWIVVQLPGDKNPQRTIGLIEKTAQLEFRMVSDERTPGEFLGPDGTTSTATTLIPQNLELLRDGSNAGRYLVVEKEVKMTGEALAQANIDFSRQFGQPMIAFVLTPDGSVTFCRLTEENVEKRMAIVLDDVVMSAPTIRDRICGGRGIIEGSFNVEQAKDLALVLRSGALPAPIEIINKYVVGATLGKDAVERGKRATQIGILLVLAFMLLYYRGSGLVAIAALAFNLLFIMGAMAIFGETVGAALTLPGIAGIVLTMGMSVDYNIIVFERIREEIKAGKTVRAAIDAGFSNAYSAIFDSAITSLIAAAVLIQFGTGPIKGFAVTYLVGVISGWFTAFVLSKALFDMRKHYDKLSI